METVSSEQSFEVRGCLVGNEGGTAAPNIFSKNGTFKWF